MYNAFGYFQVEDLSRSLRGGCSDPRAEDSFEGRIIRDLCSWAIVTQKQKQKQQQKGKRDPEPEESPSARNDLDTSREKTVGLLFLALLFSLVFWDSYWFLSKFLLLFVIFYLIYIGAKSRL